MEMLCVRVREECCVAPEFAESEKVKRERVESSVDIRVFRVGE